MTYSIIGLLAILINAIINHDVMWGIHRHGDTSATAVYRNYLLSVMFYYVTDAAWGILEENHQWGALFADTTLYFVTMALSIFLWTRYVIVYLDQQDTLSIVLHHAGNLFLAFEALCVVANLFAPVLFWIDDAGYHAGSLRYVTLGAQILLFLFTAIYTLSVSAKAQSTLRRRYRTIGIFCLAMIVFIACQVCFPLLPFYAMGSMLGSCVLHAFVLEDEKDEYRRMLEALVQKERELDRTQELAYRDSLTGVKSKHAYVEAKEGMELRIQSDGVEQFGVVVFDLDNLKNVNDTLGHEAGDRYIQEGCRLICITFDHSPVFRIGGDEFVALLEGSDFDNREALMHAFEQQVDSNLLTGDVVVSSGLAAYRPGEDHSFQAVFMRADKRMYERKTQLKSRNHEERA